MSGDGVDRGSPSDPLIREATHDELASEATPEEIAAREHLKITPTYEPKPYDPPFQRTLRIQMAAGENKEGVAFIHVDPQYHYGARWAHGGVVPALVDVASGIAIALAIPHAMHTIDGTIELKVNFLRKVYEGDMTATARVVHLGKRLAVTNVDVTNKGVLVAKALASFMLNRDAVKPADFPEAPRAGGAS